jgi:hypothetical protein
MYDIGASNKRPYDGHILLNSRFYPHEAKYQNGGLTWNVDAWKEGRQGHQYGNLLADYRHGAKPFLIIFWKKKNKTLPYVANIPLLITEHKLELAALPIVDDCEELEEWIGEVKLYQELPAEVRSKIDMDIYNSKKG